MIGDWDALIIDAIERMYPYRREGKTSQPKGYQIQAHRGPIYLVFHPNQSSSTLQVFNYTMIRKEGNIEK